MELQDLYDITRADDMPAIQNSDCNYAVESSNGRKVEFSVFPDARTAMSFQRARDARWYSTTLWVRIGFTEDRTDVPRPGWRQVTYFHTGD